MYITTWFEFLKQITLRWRKEAEWNAQFFLLFHPSVGHQQPYTHEAIFSYFSVGLNFFTKKRAFNWWVSSPSLISLGFKNSFEKFRWRVEGTPRKITFSNNLKHLKLMIPVLFLYENFGKCKQLHCCQFKFSWKYKRIIFSFIKSALK